MRSPIFHWTKASVTGWLFVLVLSVAAFAQRPAVTAPVVVKLVDEIAFKKLIVPNGKPLLINFWATWCDPCREEFPDLVKLDNEYKGKIDFITISLDDPEDIAVAVPKFLASMKAEMPAYLLKTADESAVIASVSKDWQGGMPFTILLNAKGETAYFRQGKVVLETLRGQLNKLTAAFPAKVDELHVTIDFVKIKEGKRDETMFFYEKNWKPYREEALKRGIIHSYELVESVQAATAPFDLILITRYKNEEQHKNSEKNFEPILKELRTNGPELKNLLKPDEFRQRVFIYEGKALATSIP
jgi:thiol-disulfide isomerase/thioredoxin